MKRSIAAAAALAVLALAGTPFASADTLYTPTPPLKGPGRPLRLGPDFRAAQIGDLVHVEFNFSADSANSNTVANAKQFSLGASGGTLLGFIHIPTSVGGDSADQSSHTQSGATSFLSDMMAQVVGVLPSGALEIAGDQQMMVNGQNEVLHITGFIRPEDIDSTDTVLSSRIADVHGSFDGTQPPKNPGLIRRIIGFLF